MVTRSARSRGPLSSLIPIGAALSIAGMAGLAPASSQAGSINCITTLEAPILAAEPAASRGSLLPAPVEVTRCAPVETVPELMIRRAYTWSSSYERGVDVAHQITDLLGISLAGDTGNRVMGFGFPEQTVIWDATAIHNTTAALMEQQSNPMPLRTHDLSSSFNSSVALEAEPSTANTAGSATIPRVSRGAATRSDFGVRGLW